MIQTEDEENAIEEPAGGICFAGCPAGSLVAVAFCEPELRGLEEMAFGVLKTCELVLAAIDDEMAAPPPGGGGGTGALTAGMVSAEVTPECVDGVLAKSDQYLIRFKKMIAPAGWPPVRDVTARRASSATAVSPQQVPDVGSRADAKSSLRFGQGADEEVKGGIKPMTSSRWATRLAWSGAVVATGASFLFLGSAELSPVAQRLLLMVVSAFPLVTALTLHMIPPRKRKVR